MQWIKFIFLIIKLIYYNIFGTYYIASVCGHKTKLFACIEIFGREVFVSILKKPTRCHACLAKLAIQCWCCEEPILVGDPITLYAFDEDFEIPVHAVVYSNNPIRLIGCWRDNCMDTVCDIAGYWVEPGVVQIRSGFKKTSQDIVAPIVYRYICNAKKAFSVH